MKRRSGAGGKLQGRKRSTPKRRNAPKATRNRGVSIASQESVIARLTHERDEALLRETANFEILNLISKSPGDLELVFQTILEDATRICNAKFGTLFRFDGSAFHLGRNSVRRLNLLNFKGGADHFYRQRAHTLIELCGQSE